ncbi:MAG: triphosphoribosyl-dephospho-CoA synthase [Planctomyces sp.]|jgi:triphosphoribosyl-dephospho-CoA synthase
MQNPLSDWQQHLAECVRTACVLEVMAPKPGNVSPGREFSDASVDDFLRSADSIAPVIARVNPFIIGGTILSAVKATQASVGHNTNLGIVLLLAPLAAVPQTASLESGIDAVLDHLTVEDSRFVYQAIREARPNGLGNVTQQDIADEPTETLRECMAAAASRDMIARQYQNSFREVLCLGSDLLAESSKISDDLMVRIPWLSLRLLAESGDSLIARKCGTAVSDSVRAMAQNVLNAGWPDSNAGKELFEQFDEFLRDGAHRHNPGTTADLVAAILFAALRDGRLSAQSRTNG